MNIEICLVVYEVHGMKALGNEEKERKTPLLAMLVACVRETTMSVPRYLCLEVVSRSGSFLSGLCCMAGLDAVRELRLLTYKCRTYLSFHMGVKLDVRRKKTK
jgi:hypothetical protein